MLLVGLFVLLGGLILRLPPAATVMCAAFLIAAGAGMTAGETVDLFGKSFVQNRSLTLFLLTLPALGLCERHGLHRWAGDFIVRFSGRGPGGLLWSYQWLRVLQGILGVRINGHASFVRPLLAPMAEARSDAPEAVRAHCAVVENLGNFYGQNLNPAQPGVLLVWSTLQGAGVNVSPWWLAAYAVVPCSFALLLSWLRYRRLA